MAGDAFFGGRQAEQRGDRVQCGYGAEPAAAMKIAAAARCEMRADMLRRPSGITWATAGT